MAIQIEREINTEENLVEESWESNVIDWAKGNKKLWNSLSPEAHNILGYYYINPGIDDDPLHEQLSGVLNMPPEEALKVRDSSMEILGKAWEKDQESEEEEYDSFETKDLEDDQITAAESDISYYMKALKRYPLLNSLQEKLLFKFKKDFPESNEIIRNQEFIKLFPDTDKEKVKNLQADSINTTQIIVHCNMRLVVNVAKNYRGFGLPFMDLISEGNIGLIKAVKKFDYEKGYKFSTYARWWIMQGVRGALDDKVRIIHLPVYIITRINTYHKAIRILMNDLGHEPSINEIGKYMGLSDEKVRELIKVSKGTNSLNAKIGDEYDTELGDLIPDKEQHTDLAGESAVLEDQVQELLGLLTPKNRRIIEMRYGLGKEKDNTLEEISKEFGVTRERIRQLQRKAEKKLGESTKIKKLKDFN